jgi:thiol-disulfide isomerase/thioredoxin
MIAIFLAALALPAAAAEPSLLKTRPASALVDEVVELRPIDGHHFNVEAPQRCGADKPLEVLPRRLRCQLTKPGVAAFLVSVCDDALTFCRQESFDVKVAGVAKAAAKTSPVKAAPKGGKGAPAGFIDNEPARARALARREGRLLLIDFYGIWCPPCNQLEEEAYPDPAFQAASADFVKVGLDADAVASFDWKAHFKVGGYPTLIVADANLTELGRVVGSRSGPALAKFLTDVKAYRDEPVETAAALVAKGGPDATELRRLRVAHWRAERGEFDGVEKLLAGIDDPYARRELLLARREQARLQDDQPARLTATKALIADFPRDAAFASWVDELAAADKNAAAPLREAVRASVALWSTNAALGDSEYAPADLLYEEASIAEQLGSTEEAKGLWSQTADAYGAEAAKSPLKVPRAANFGRADALLKAGRKAEAKSLYESLVKAYPEEFTFNYEYASELNDDGDASAAYPYAVKAAETAYGDNWLRAVRLKGALELKLGRPGDAAKTVDEALAQTVPPKSAQVRTYRYVNALRALRRDITAAKTP